FVKDLPLQGLDPATLLASLHASPQKREQLAELQAHYYQEWLKLWSQDFPDDGNTLAPADADRRFDSPEWHDLPWFRALRRIYQLNADYLQSLTDLAELEPRMQRRFRFAIHQLIDALAPTNYAATNPDAIKLAFESGGESLARGMKLLSEDIARGRISMTDESAFEVGKNLAVTPGDVVYENEIAQLIQYRPSTAQVYERPLIIIPPFINKYYILDLQPENSFVRFCVERGFTTFIVSWRNIPPQLGHLTWDDYLEQGVFAPIKAVREITGSLTINALGFCVGGTLLATGLAVLAAKRHKPVASLTLLASMLDYSDTGEISVFVDPSFVAQCEAEYHEGGLVPGFRLAATFATLRANDLVWYFVVNNYLLGRAPRPFDLLYWNADGSNLPGPLYAFYLRNMYLENNLRVPDKLRLCGVPVDLGKITLPAYVVATREDHIVPWKSAYLSARFLGGRTDFVLGASGHVAGLVNPASQNRRHYWTGPDTMPEPERWLETAHEHPGSWWPRWSEWLAQHAGNLKSAPRATGGSGYAQIESAPGRYVRERDMTHP
ncbi:MAG: PHA/PHB synthase family protein, partial [Burkholderiales bacterium]